MGTIYNRSAEHLGTTDALIIRTRRCMINAAKALRDQGVTQVLVSHDLDEAHEMSGAEKVQPDYPLWPRSRRSDGIKIEVGRVRGQDGIGAGEAIELCHQLRLDRHVLEHRLDDEIGIVGAREVPRDQQARGAGTSLIVAQSPCLECGFVDCRDTLLPVQNCLFIGIDKRDSEAGRKERTGNAASHRARADHCHRRDLR